MSCAWQGWGTEKHVFRVSSAATTPACYKTKREVMEMGGGEEERGRGKKSGRAASEPSLGLFEIYTRF